MTPEAEPLECSLLQREPMVDVPWAWERVASVPAVGDGQHATPSPDLPDVLLLLLSLWAEVSSSGGSAPETGRDQELSPGWPRPGSLSPCGFSLQCSLLACFQAPC